MLKSVRSIPSSYIRKCLDNKFGWTFHDLSMNMPVGHGFQQSLIKFMCGKLTNLYVQYNTAAMKYS